MSVTADEDRAAAFHRMRAVATGLLALMAVVFVAASYGVRHAWPAAAWVRAFAEAAMVGACADWFAVTALFRRPFGLPIPHTGIVPRNKARIGEALGAFIAGNFLTEEVLTERLRELEVAQWGGAWVRRPQNARLLAQRLTQLAPTILDALPEHAIRDVMASAALSAARAVPAATVASKALEGAWSGGRAQAVIGYALDLVGGYLEQHQDIILEKVHSQSWRWMPGWVDKMIARKITAGMIQLLIEMRDPDHPWRLELDDTVKTWVERLAEDPEMRARCEALKLRLLDDPQLRGRIGEVWSELEAGLNADLRSPDGVVALRLEQALLVWATWIDSDPTVQRILNEGARAVVRGLVAPNRHKVGDFVARVVSAWDTRSIVEKLEQQVGRDLQYIRINGTVVGGLVGLLIYAVSRWTGLG